MKKIYLSIVALFVAAVCFAQSQRLILMEEFTQASCPPCAVYNPGFNAILNANPTKIVAIKYQTSWPGYDPMNLQNASEVQSRVTYYAVGGVPDGVMDGNAWHNNPANFTQALINNRYPVASPFTVDVSHTFTANYDAINVHVEITASQAFNLPSNLRIAVIERDIQFCTPPGSNGETHFEGVMKKMLPNATGTVLPSAWTLGQTETYDFTWNLANVYDKNTIAVVAFVQNATTKEVHQTGYSDEQQMQDDARLICNAVSIPPLICNNSVAPVVTFQNLGSATLSSLTINYQLDGGAVTPVTWNGSVASGATGVFTFPPLTMSTGSHTIVVTAVNPNGTPDLNTYWDNATKTFNVASSSSTALPLIQDFVSALFPPANWTRVNNDNGPTWTRVVQGNVSVGSAKMNFLQSPDGEIDELWTPACDFAAGGITTAQLDFDVAYKQYVNENDRIQIEVTSDCGLTWTNIWDYSGAALAFGNAPFSGGAFTPTLASEWHHQTVSMNSFIGNPSVATRFIATSNSGNNAYIDNINITFTTGIHEATLYKNIKMYPNPTDGKIYLDINFEQANDLKVEIFNTLGEKVNGFEFSNALGGIYPMDLTALANGSYIVKISTGDEMLVKPLQITK